MGANMRCRHISTFLLLLPACFSLPRIQYIQEEPDCLSQECPQDDQDFSGVDKQTVENDLFSVQPSPLCVRLERDFPTAEANIQICRDNLEEGRFEWARVNRAVCEKSQDIVEVFEANECQQPSIEIEGRQDFESLFDLRTIKYEQMIQ